MLRKDFPLKEGMTRFTSVIRIVGVLVISLVIVKIAQPAMAGSLHVHLLQAVHSTPPLYHPSSATVVEVPIT